MIDHYLDCFQNNISYILKKEGIDYYKAYKPSIKFSQYNFEIERNNLKQDLENIGFEILKYSTTNENEFIEIIEKNKKLISIVKTNIVDLKWSINSGSNDDDHWLTIENDKIQDPYYDKYNLDFDIRKIFSHVVPNIGNHYTVIFVKKLNNFNNKTNKYIPIELDYPDKLRENLLNSIKYKITKEPRESELFYSKLLNIANSRMQLYKYIKKNFGDNNLTKTLFLGYQNWISLANIYFKLILGHYDWHSVSERVSTKTYDIYKTEKELYEEIQ